MEGSWGVAASKSSDLLEWLHLGLAIREEEVVGMGCVCETRDRRLVSGDGEDNGVAS